MSPQSVPVGSGCTDSPQTAYKDGNGHIETIDGAKNQARAHSTIDEPAFRPAASPTEIQLALTQQTPRATWAGLGLVFASTIFVSAFLLFQVQPLISKYILPWF